MKQTLILILFMVVLIATQPLWANVEDANALLTVARVFDSNDFKAESMEQLQWLEKEAGYTWVREDEDANDIQEIVHYNPETDQTNILVTALQLMPQGQRSPLKIAGYQWSVNMKKVLIFTNTEQVWRQHTRGDYWVLDRDSNDLFQIGGSAEPSHLMFAKFSPDGTRVAYVYKRNIYVQQLASQHIRKLTRTLSDTIINGTSDWLYEEELGLRDGFRWSPDGSAIAYWQFDVSDVNEFVLVNYTDDLYPRLKRFAYPKAGQTNAACRVGVVKASGGRTCWIKVPGDGRNNYIHAMEWMEDSSDLVIQQLNRLQNTHRLYYCTVKKGLLGKIHVSSPKIIFTDTDTAWVNPDIRPEWIDHGRAFLWLSERDGWNHVYQVDRFSGAVTLFSPGTYDVIRLLRVDEQYNRMYVIASPDNPTQRYLYSIPLSGGEAERVTPKDETGTHNYNVSPDSQWAVHTHSTFDQPPKIDLIRLPDHQVHKVLENNDKLQQAVAALKPCATEFFSVPISDEIRLPGWMIKPPDFDPNQQYPILFYVYGEPAGQTVLYRWGEERGLWHLMLAQQGYLVASLDNRGTPAPLGRYWRKCIYRQIGVVASQDQAAGVRELLRTRPYIDLNRVGIWGWSGGGSMTLNMIFRYPDLYDTGLSVAFVSDLHYYDTIYQERYMGLPSDNEEGYIQGSPITFADQLKGNLLLVYGTGDDNCHYQNCEALINKLVEYNKPFTLMTYPNRRHDLAQGENTKVHLHELLTRYLREHLPVNEDR